MIQGKLAYSLPIIFLMHNKDSYIIPRYNDITLINNIFQKRTW